MLRTINFNGVTKPYLFLLRGLDRQSWAPKENEIISVPGRAGGYLSDSRTNVRTLSVPVYIEKQEQFHFQKTVEDLASWLVTDTPKPLIFTDEPDRTYYAIIDNTLTIEALVLAGTGTLTFICPDPYKYGPTKSITAPVQAGVVQPIQLINNGTAKAKPIFKIKLKSPTTFVSVGNGKDLNMVGEYNPPGQTPVQPFERKYWTECNTLTGWTDATTTEDGTVGGKLKSDGYVFWSDEYGTGSAWHGPTMKTSLSESLQDFRIDVLVRLKKIKDSDMGRILITGLDESSNTVARMQLWKPNAWRNYNEAIFAAGHGAQQKTLYREKAFADWAWSPFDGIIRIERVGKRWSWMASTIEKGVYTYLTGRSWVDEENKFPSKIRQIQVHLSQYGTNTVPSQQIEDIKVYKVNQVTTQQTQNIGQKDDEIIFDHKGRKILKNGESIKNRKAFVGKYFDLEKGINALTFEPANAIESAEVMWEEVYL